MQKPSPDKPRSLRSLRPADLFVLSSRPVPFILLVTLTIISADPDAVRVPPVSFQFNLN